jgi:hypothetical protein
MEFTKEQIEKAFEKLPEDLKDALNSTDVYEDLLEILKKHDLMLDQGSILEQEIGLVLLGLVPVENFSVRLKSALKIPSSKAQEITVDINQKVFQEYRDALRQIHEKIVIDDEEAIDRDELLREIESIGEVKHEPIVSPEAKIEVPPADEVNKESQIPENPQSEVKGIVDKQMSEPTVSQKSEKTIELGDDDKPSPPAKVDPYREPIE